jgi:hypothetical protein
LAIRIARSRKRLDPAPVNRQIGRILQQNQRAAARFTVALEPDGCPAGFRLHVACNASFDDWAALSEHLSPALEHRRLERSTALEGLHPAHPGRSGFSHPEGSAESAPHLAPARRTRPSFVYAAQCAALIVRCEVGINRCGIFDDKSVAHRRGSVVVIDE